MGNNVYETPRNQSKWHTTNDRKVKSMGQSIDDKQARLQRLKEMAQKQKQQQAQEK